MFQILEFVKNGSKNKIFVSIFLFNVSSRNIPVFLSLAIFIKKVVVGQLLSLWRFSLSQQGLSLFKT